MAGSWQHMTAESGTLRNNESFCEMIENLGDAGIFVDWRDVDGYVRALRTLALPGPYAAACKKVLARAQEQQTMRAHDEEVWCARVVALGSRRHSMAALA